LEHFCFSNVLLNPQCGSKGTVHGVLLNSCMVLVCRWYSH